VVRVGNTLYIGGAFSSVGRSSGGGVLVDNESGAPIGHLPRVTGYVYSVASDGAGGWFIGGDFHAVGGVPRINLAHILSDGSVARWAPNPNGYIPSITVCGGTVLVAGAFTIIGGVEKHYMAALDPISGSPSPWNPKASGIVRTVVVESRTVYAGGDFDSI